MPGHRSNQGASHRSCDRCGAAVLRQEVGRRAALKVTADFAPVSLAEAAELVEPNRLAWCVSELRGGGWEMRWRCRPYGSCAHGLVIEHRCPPQSREFGRQPEGALW